MSELNHFKHDSVQDSESVVAYLEAVLEGLKAGKLTLASGGKEMDLAPQGMVKLSVEGKAKGTRRKLRLKFSWTEGEEDEATSEPLNITTKGA